MAEEGSDGQEKTEDPSQRKIDKSLEEGKVLKSQEVNIFTSLAAGLGVDVCRSQFCQSRSCYLGFIFPIWVWL